MSRNVLSHVACATAAPQTANANRFPWSEWFDYIFRNEEVAGSNLVSFITPPGEMARLWPGPGLTSRCGVLAARLSNFVDTVAKATMVGEVFDDASIGHSLLNYFLRAISCGAITEEGSTNRTGLTVDELRTRSFLRIPEGRRTG